MSEQRAQGPPGGPGADEILWILLRDLTALSRAQARLMGDLAKMIEQMRRAGASVERTGEVGTAGAERAQIVAEPPGAASAAAPPAEAAPAVPPAQPTVETATAPPLSHDERTSLLEVEAGVEGNGKKPLVEETRIPIEEESDHEGEAEREGEPEREGASDGAAEGADELDESLGEKAVVLTLESGDARVGVLWDHVIQIGSIGTPTIPEKVETQRGVVELVSLGLLLHGDSREEKYFVVLEQDGERAAVACERMLGVERLGAAMQEAHGARIQVLKVPMLRTFSASAKPVRPSIEISEEQKAADERDRNGPLRALVAVRYLPARVAICRHLRGRGWQVGEAAGLEAATVSLDLGRWDLLFLEAHGNGESEATEGILLRRVMERGVPVIRVGSRISGFPGREGPALMFPFSEAELDAILTAKRSTSNA
jgi:hypothetical protein